MDHPADVAARTALHRRVDNDLTLHPPADPSVGRAMGDIRERFIAHAHAVIDATPVCREQSLALTKLEEAQFYAIAALARYQPATPGA